ncbi:hypothetical protein ACTAQI_11730 [Pseudarthrobacter sp. alpha12b]
MRDKIDATFRSVNTDQWTLEVSENASENAPLICIPTIHPRGDQRVLRCAQAALRCGYRVKFFWLGEGKASTDSIAAEEIFSRASSFKQRLIQLPKVALRAHKENAQAWHIHDLYMLPIALVWATLTRGRVVYDVHEYYSSYYVSKISAPQPVKTFASKLIDNFQVWAAKRIGGANVVAMAMSVRYSEAGVPVSVSPNFPLRKSYDKAAVSNDVARFRRVIHTGTLSEPYGMKSIVDLAVLCEQRGYDVTIDLVRRFPNAHQEKLFVEYVNERGFPGNLRLIPAVTADKIPTLLSSYGIGLSMITKTGQNDLAVPTKLYEYALMGLAIVGTDRTAQKQFVEEYAVGKLCGEQDIEGLANAIYSFGRAEQEEIVKIEGAAALAKTKLFWDNGPETDVKRLLTEVFPLAQFDEAKRRG